MRVLVALGGNAMTSADGSATPGAQIESLTEAARHVVRLVQAGHEVVVTHGNGPQVGNLLVKNELAAGVVPPVPLDWCGAQTQGTVGFVLLDALDPLLAQAGLPQRPTAVVSRTLVRIDDPGFARPTKPIGRYVDAEQARKMMEHGQGQHWEDRGERGWRRVVASPEPVECLDAPVVRALVDSGHLVVAGGGGGIPVVREDDGSLRGVEAVIDKDLGAVLLARAVGAEALVIATDVDNAVIGWGTPDARPLGRTPVHEMRALAEQGHFGSGSMGPKVEAACRFVEDGGRMSVITALNRISDALDGEAGTIVEADPDAAAGATAAAP